MSRWRAEAIARLPEHRKLIETSHQLMFLWCELNSVFERAYRPPANEDVIRRIYDFAKWCDTAPRDADAGRDPLTCVAVAFYAHVPTNAAARDDMHRWLSVADVAASCSIFSYHIGDEAYEEVLATMKARLAAASARDRPRKW